ncbi:NUDIX domain-containing protein [Thermophilibacter provencensis]|uniref:NUDIX hydrolase n=1 Tax=Thermophilibacter provencensis TaxID=1852386 RepID=A0ABT7V3P5_9ACTN|nr:NUDIX hydrolase [Thermophilibacter provencensis]MDM8271227.1 NUDIX hydrolase [Thermophilibacter provencensis]
MSEGLDVIRRALEHDEALYEKVVSSKTEWEGMIFSVERQEVELSDGSHGLRDLVRHHGGAGVVAVMDGRVCLVRQYRVALDRMTLEIPAGKVDPAEPRDVCAARELTEETGLVADRLELLTEAYGAPGFTNEHTSVYYAHGLTQGPSRLDEGEFLNVVWVDVDDAIEAIRLGLIDDAKTVTGILAAKAYGML